jgi:hypothetical protein
MKSDAELDRTEAYRHLVALIVGQLPTNGETTGEELTELAAQALERYAEDLLEQLLADAKRLPEPADSWIRGRFAEGLDRAGTALREVLASSRHRHTVAQGLQRKMFEAEIMLRRAIKSRGPEATVNAIVAS